MDDGTGSTHSGISSTTLVDSAFEERERLQTLLIETQREELEAEATAAVAAAERAVLEREILAGDRDLKDLNPKETMQAILKFDQALEEESEAKSRLLEVASQLLKQVQDQYNELYDQLQEERRQRNALLGALQGIHEECEQMEEELVAGGGDGSFAFETSHEGLGLEPSSSSLATPVKGFHNGKFSSRVMSPVSQRSLTPLGEPGDHFVGTPTSMQRLDLDKVGQLLKAAQNARTPSAIEKVLHRVRNSSKFNSPRLQDTNPRSGSSKPKKKGLGGVFGIFGAVAGNIWNTSKLVTKLVTNLALAPVRIIMLSRSSALLSATCLGAVALISVGQVRNGAGRRRVI